MTVAMTTSTGERADPGRAARAVPVRDARRRAARLAGRARLGRRAARPAAPCSTEGEPAEVFVMLLSGTHRDEPAGRRRTTSRRCAPTSVGVYAGADAGVPRVAGPEPSSATPRPCASVSRRAVLRAARRGLRDGGARVVPDGDPPARGAVPRHAQPQPADRRPAPAAARPRRAGGRADARAEQPGGGRGPRDRRAARAGRGHAAQAGDARARRDRPQAARAARRRAGGGRPGGRAGPRAVGRRGVRARGRARPTGSTSTASAARGSSRRSSSPAARRPTSSTRSPTGASRRSLDGGVRWLAYTLETELLLGRDHRLGDPHLDAGRRGASSTRTWTARRSSGSTSTTGSRAPW